MALSLKQSFTLKGLNGQEATFSIPFVNDEKQLEFKFCSFFTGKILLNEEKKAIELQSEKKKIFLLLRGENESLFDECMEIRKQILSDLRQLTQNFQTGKEPIYAIESGNEQYPYLITSPLVLENGLHSVKYSKAIIYFINEGVKKKGKKTNIDTYNDLLEKVGQALHKSDLSQFEQGKFGEDKYYSVPLDKVVELL
ncbi:hypothetical protein CVD28_04220 [Bacillus sp. M6-12]|uniref:hypothetical protein n=1 Tax=Bacillus sp. M6-12 TaxID=2054166 RepID=UPI000C773400|nr:hypothetical protein [Bacillus sp. M6-12]PLS19630.1 hypothetical protein CVD28_04220 [Bacillus sp. M6-12]